MKAKVKATGKVPELEFLGRKQAKLTTPARHLNGEYRVRWEIDLDATSPEQAAREALEIQRDPGSTATFFEVQNHKGKSCQIDIETL